MSNDATVNNIKKKLREESKRKLDGLSGTYMQNASKAIMLILRSLEEYREAETVFCYMSCGKEVSTGELISRMLSDGKRVCIPLCMEEQGDRIMLAKLYKDGDELVPGSFGIPEPKAEMPTVKPEDIDLAVIPCSTCDRAGNRLGKGAGYYDRYLAKEEATGIFKAALCYEDVMADEVPADEHDVVMDLVLTERGIYEGR
jgi:5-formyltetrahydrofolate cyclo-ligase